MTQKQPRFVWWFDLLTCPAQLWMKLCAWICGGTYVYGSPPAPEPCPHLPVPMENVLEAVREIGTKELYESFQAMVEEHNEQQERLAVEWEKRSKSSKRLQKWSYVFVVLYIGVIVAGQLFNHYNHVGCR